MICSSGNSFLAIFCATSILTSSSVNSGSAEPLISHFESCEPSGSGEQLESKDFTVQQDVFPAFSLYEYRSSDAHSLIVNFVDVDRGNCRLEFSLSPATEVFGVLKTVDGRSKAERAKSAWEKEIKAFEAACSSPPWSEPMKALRRISTFKRTADGQVSYDSKTFVGCKSLAVSNGVAFELQSDAVTLFVTTFLGSVKVLGSE